MKLRSKLIVINLQIRHVKCSCLEFEDIIDLTVFISLFVPAFCVSLKNIEKIVIHNNHCAMHFCYDFYEFAVRRLLFFIFACVLIHTLRVMNLRPLIQALDRNNIDSITSVSSFS